jgi:hypothetical protein
MKTIHCLAGEIVDLYAGPLGLPRPLQPVNGLPTFDAMVGLAVDILGRRPEVARGLALRHPLILVDEYQDCSVDQAALVWAIAGAAPTRLRLFGDDLQAIFEFTGSQVDWGDLTASHPSVALETPWRWSRQPAMGRFLLDARRPAFGWQPGRPTGCPRLCHRSALGRRRSKPSSRGSCRLLLGLRQGAQAVQSNGAHA